MIVLTVEEVLMIHSRLIAKTGGLDGVRERGILESAVLNCMQTFDDEELYPTVIEKSARIAYAICQSHPYVDGNKRTAVLAMMIKLRTNQVDISYTQQQLIDLGLSMAMGNMDYSDICAWIKGHQI